MYNISPMYDRMIYIDNLCSDRAKIIFNKYQSKLTCDGRYLVEDPSKKTDKTFCFTAEIGRDTNGDMRNVSISFIPVDIYNDDDKYMVETLCYDGVVRHTTDSNLIQYIDTLRDGLLRKR